MSLNIGDIVKSYDFILGDMLLNDKAFVVGEIVDIAPVDWCADNCDHYHIKVLERFDLQGEAIEVIGDMIYPPVHESMVVLSDWPNDELEAESIYDYVTGRNRSCAWCGGNPKFMVYDLPTGPHAFCSEKHYARFTGMDEKPPGWYGYDAETGSESHDCGVCGTAVTILNDDYGTCPKCKTFWNLVRLQDLWDTADDDIKVLDAETTVMLESVKPQKPYNKVIVRFKTSDDRIIEILIDSRGLLNREEVIVKAAKVLDRKLSQKCDGCQVSGWDEVLIEDRRPAYIDDEGDGCSIGKVISCQPCMQLEDADWIASAFQPKSKEAESENWGGDPEGPLAKALAKAREDSKKPKKPLKIEKLSAESNQKFRREAILFGIGVVSAVTGTFLAEMLIDRYREDPELLDTPAPEQNA